MKSVAMKVQPRAAIGKQPAKELRRQGLVPGIIYGIEQPQRAVQLNEHNLTQFLRGRTSEHFLVDLEVEGDQPRKAIIKEIQRHPVSGRIVHVDFNAISMTRKLRIEVPVKLLGEPVGVTQTGGVLDHMVRTILVECLPAEIPEQFTLDVSALTIGQRLCVSDIAVDRTKLTILNAAELAVAAVAAPRAEEVVEPTAAEAAAEGPEVLTEKKVEGEEGAAEVEGKEGKKEAKKEGAKEAQKEEAPKKGGEGAAAKKGKEEPKKK
ncbi:MAG: 50S ribosomal protein L25 [Kiritimatiellaeota bacterium]|nr:50S ribosomal protein L25 [Kiritimatiellota bacterium]